MVEAWMLLSLQTLLKMQAYLMTAQAPFTVTISITTYITVTGIFPMAPMAPMAQVIGVATDTTTQAKELLDLCTHFLKSRFHLMGINQTRAPPLAIITDQHIIEETIRTIPRLGSLNRRKPLSSRRLGGKETCRRLTLSFK